MIILVTSAKKNSLTFIILHMIYDVKNCIAGNIQNCLQNWRKIISDKVR